jgi:hypothetical protein
MLKPSGYSLVSILAATFVALALRLPELAQRPMHGDEAVHAIKFGALLEQGFYRYDSFEYHGPTLNYLTLIPAWLTSARELAAVSEWTLRLVPVFFGTSLIFMTAILCAGMGREGSVIAATLAGRQFRQRWLTTAATTFKKCYWCASPSVSSLARIVTLKIGGWAGLWPQAFLPA